MRTLTETGIKETPRDRLAWARRAGVGRVSAVAVIAGVLVGYGAFAVLVGAATAVVAALGINADLTERQWRNAGDGAGIVAGILLLLAYLFGGYVSGRMARRAGLINGLLVFIGGLSVAATTVGIVQAAGESGEAMARLRESLANFGVPTSGSQWGAVGTVAGIGALAGMLLGAVLGGVLGERWHAKMARAALDTEVRDNQSHAEDRDVVVGRDDVGPASVNAPRTSGGHAVETSTRQSTESAPKTRERHGETPSQRSSDLT